MKVTDVNTVVYEGVHLGTQADSACLPFALKTVATATIGTAAYLWYREVEASAMPKVTYHLFNYWVRGIKPTLFDAIKEGNTLLFKALLIAGCDPCVRYIFNETPLHHAAQAHQEEIVKLLLKDSRVDVNARDSHGFTPLHLLLRTNYGKKCRNLAELLLNDPRIDLNARAENGETLLHSAVQGFKTDVIPLLVANPSVNVNAQDSSGNTPLHYSRSSFCSENLFERSDIELNIPNNLGETPLLRALKKGRRDVAKILAQKGAKFFPLETHEETVLRRAIFLGEEENAISLLKKGISLLNTPLPIPYLCWACEKEQYSLVIELILAARKETAKQVVTSRGYLNTRTLPNYSNERSIQRKLIDCLEAYASYGVGPRKFKSTALHHLFDNYSGPELDEMPSREQIEQLEAQYPELIAIRLLLESGARLLPIEQRRLKITPLDQAYKDNFVLLYYLEQYRGWIDQQDNEGFTPLQRQVKNIDERKIEFLIRLGAKLKGDEMKTALSYHNAFVVEALLNHPDFVIAEEEKKILKERYTDDLYHDLPKLREVLLSE